MTRSQRLASVHQARPDRHGIAAHLADLAAQAETMVDIASAFASERGDDTAADMLFWCGRAPLDRESPADLDQSSEAATAPGNAPCVAGSDGTVDGAGDGVRLSARPDAPAALDRLSGGRRQRSTRVATIFSRPRRGWRASLRSPKATFRRGIGSGSAAPSRRSRMAPH